MGANANGGACGACGLGLGGRLKHPCVVSTVAAATASVLHDLMHDLCFPEAMPPERKGWAVVNVGPHSHTRMGIPIKSDIGNY